MGTHRGINYVVPKVFKETQIINLIDLAHAIQNSPPPEFNMKSYGQVNSEIGPELESLVFCDGSIQKPEAMFKIGQSGHTCGAVACALGTGAWNGIGDVGVTSWEEYSYNSFGIGNYSEEWVYLFGSGWGFVDNTPEGAVSRILKFVTEGPSFIEDIVHSSEYSCLDEVIDMQLEEENVLLMSYKEYDNIKIGEVENV